MPTCKSSRQVVCKPVRETPAKADSYKPTTPGLRDQTEVDRRASPGHPQLPEPLTAQSTAHDIWASNIKLVLSYGSKTDQWFLHLHPIAFKDGAAKANWRTFHDTQAFHTFAYWIKEKMEVGPNLTCRVGFFCTWTTSWVGKATTEWKGLPWHAWGAALRPCQEFDSGKELIIWDSNFYIKHSSSKPVHLSQLLGMQRNLVAFLDKQVKLRKIYIGGDGNKGKGICMLLTQRWISGICSNYQESLPCSKEQLQALGYREVSRKSPSTTARSKLD